MKGDENNTIVMFEAEIHLWYQFVQNRRNY